MSARAADVTSGSTRYVAYVIGLLAVVNVFNYMDRMALAVLAPLIQSDLRLSDSQLGLLLGFAFALFYALCGLPIARWADRGTRRTIIAAALATWSAMTALSGAAQNFWHLLLARVGVGAGEAGGLAPAHSLLCDYVPPQRRGGAFALINFGLITGATAGLMIAGALGAIIGWRWTFLVLGLPGLLLAAVVRFTLREPVRGRFEAPSEQAPAAVGMSFGSALGILWRCRTYRLIVLFLCLNGFVQYGLLQWWPSLYGRLFGASLSNVGVSLGLAFGVGSGVGVLLGGTVANWAAKRDARSPLVVGAAALAIAGPMAVASLFVSSAGASLMLVLLTQLCWGLLAGPVYAALFNVTKPHLRATGSAIMLFASSVIGHGLGPFFVGLMSDLLTPTFGVEALRYAMLAPLVLFPILVLLIYTATKSLPRDLHAAGV